MKMKSISFLATIFLSILLLRQSNGQSSFYKHLEGNIAEGIHMKADLVGVDGKLTGYYYYYFVDTLRQMDFGVHYGKSMPVSGSIKTDNSLEFKEFADDMEGASFRGMLMDGVISGDWVNAAGTRTLPFELKETYPEGTIAFYVFHLSDEGKLLDSRTTPVATVDLTLLLPKPYASAAPVDSANAVIYREFFGLDSAAGDPIVLLNESRDMFFNNYRKANADLYQEGAASFDWMKAKAVRIQYNEKQILSLEFYDHGYTGGAHGLSLSKFIVLSLNDGHKITLEEIFRPDFRNDLRDILNSQIRDQYDISKNTDLRDAGFWVEALDPSDNFYLNKDGIGFYYNQYEVAPFAMGPVDIFIPYHKLKRIMDPESEVYNIIDHRE